MSITKLGMIGFSEANGHPFSFSAIINGYDKNEFEKTEWGGILNYLEARDKSEISTLNSRVTHIWTQDFTISQQIAKCCKIDNVSNNYIDMIGNVDAVILARDDFGNHLEMATPFLKKGIPVFIDKPLTLDKKELLQYEPYYNKGLVMSCSGLRYCQELDSIRDSLETYGDVRLVRCAVINNWEKYGIHMLDATLGIWDIEVRTVSCTSYKYYDSYMLEFDNGMLVQIDTMGPNIVTFSFELFGTKKCEKREIRDNFTSFKRTLALFLEQVKTKKPAIKWSSLNRSISVLAAGQEAKQSNQKVEVRYE